MSFLEKARQAAAQAAAQAATAVDKAGQATADMADRAGAKMTDPATKEQARAAFSRAKRGVATAIDRIDPSVLADVVIKATALQEKANSSLKAKGSLYRINQIEIGAAIPPSVVFTIQRLDAAEDAGLDSTRLVAGAAGGDGSIQALDGSTIDESDLTDTAG